MICLCSSCFIFAKKKILMPLIEISPKWSGIIFEFFFWFFVRIVNIEKPHHINHNIPNRHWRCYYVLEFKDFQRVAQNPGTSTITCSSLYATTCSSGDTLYVGPLNLCWNGNIGSYPIDTNNGIGQPLPSSATKLYGFAFASCALLTSVTFSIGTSCAYKSATVTTTVSPTNQVQLLSYLYYVFVDLSSNPVSYPAGSNFVLHDCLPSSTSWAHYQIFSYCACCSTGSGSGSSNNNDQFMVSFKVDA